MLNKQVFSWTSLSYLLMICLSPRVAFVGIHVVDMCFVLLVVARFICMYGDTYGEGEMGRTAD